MQLEATDSSLILVFSSKVEWVIRFCFLFCFFFVFLIFCERHWKFIFLFGWIILTLILPGCCPGNEVLLRVSTASHCRFKSRKTELTEAISLLDFPSMRQVSKCFLQIFFAGFLGFFYIIWWCKAFKTISHVNIFNYFGICIYMHLLRHKIRMQLVYMLAYICWIFAITWIQILTKSHAQHIWDWLRQVGR